MSRGFGRVERTILSALSAGRPLSVEQLAAFAYFNPPTEPGGPEAPRTTAQLTSIRRALSRLQEQRLVFKLGATRDERCVYADQAGALAWKERRDQAIALVTALRR